MLDKTWALQTSDEQGVATPEGWQPGDKVIVPLPATAEQAEAQVAARVSFGG